MLEVKSINVSYGDIQVIYGVSLEVNEGELISIFGPNGHGKTTLLKAICGLVTPTSGEIKFKGKNVNQVPSYKLPERGLVYISEEGNPFPDLTVRENLELGAYNKRASNKEKENLKNVYQIFPRLKEREDYKAKSLSGGEHKMLALGRGLMASADFMLIDEPSFGLAPKLVEDVYRQIKKINEEEGITEIVVDQNVTKLADMSDRICFLEEGRKVFEGGKEEALKDNHLKDTFFSTT